MMITLLMMLLMMLMYQDLSGVSASSPADAMRVQLARTHAANGDS
jgi:hypothetical protein